MDKDVSTLLEARRLSEAIASSLPDRIQIGALTLNSKLPFKALSLREFLIHRISPLATPAVDLFERGQVIPAIVLTRAVHETVAVFYSMRKRLERFLEDKDVQALDEFLMQCLFGSRNNPGKRPARNVLSFVDDAAKNVPEFRTIYDSLSEYAHPNWAGTFGSFGEIDKENFEVKLGPTGRTRAWVTGVSALAGALMLFHHYYNDSADLIRRLNDHFEQGGPVRP